METYITINTLLLQAVLNKIKLGIGGNRILAYTNYITFEIREDLLTLTTTDSSNFYIHYINLDERVEEPVAFSIIGEAFIQLISRSTSETVEIEVLDKSVNVHSNGTYVYEKIEELIPVTIPMLNVESYDITGLSISKLNVAESGLDKQVVDRSLMGYYLTGTQVVTTNGVKLCKVEDITPIELPTTFLSLEFVNLLRSCEGTKTLYRIDGKIVVATENSVIIGPEQSNVENYPDVSGLMEQLEGIYPQSNRIKLDSKKLTECLSRLSIFNSTHVYLNAEKGILSLTTNKKNSTVEKLYEDPNILDARIPLSIPQLLDLVSKHVGEVELLYADEQAPIMLKAKNITQVLAPIEEPDNG